MNSKNPDVASFLKRNHIAVLATANPAGEPHAAAVYYDTDLKMNVYFLSKEGTTKNNNLTSNPRAAVAIYEADSQRTAQISGYVERVEDKQMIEKALRIMARFSKGTAGTDETPLSKIKAGEHVLYRLKPQTVRLAEYKYGVQDYLFNVATPAEESLE